MDNSKNILSKEDVINAVKIFAGEVIKVFPVKKIVLFGSYAKGNFNGESDIDVAVITDKLNSDLLDNEFILYKIRRNINFRIEPVLFEGDSDKSGFLQEILSTGDVIYPS